MTDAGQESASHLPSPIALVANADERLSTFRGPIIQALTERRVQVFAIAPPGRYVKDIEALGAEFVPWRLNRQSYNPLLELCALLALTGIYRRLRPQLVQHFTIKPNIYGAIAARLARVPVVVGGVTGLGYLFTQGSDRRGLMRTAVMPLFRIASTLSDRIIFQNQDDIDLLVRGRGLSRPKGLLVPGGSGVDLQAFNPHAVGPGSLAALRADLGLPQDAPVVLLAARMLYDKGIVEFVEAAHLVRREIPEAQFLLAGGVDTGSRGGIPDGVLKGWTEEGAVRYLGRRGDMPALLALADIVALPSYYREGVPRVLLEAAAMGRPIVGTDMPGTRDAVEHEINGLLIPPRDSTALAQAIARLLRDGALRSRLGNAGREKARREFDQGLVVERYLAEYARLWATRNR